MPSEFAALLEEQRLIATLRPPYNVAGNNYRASLAFIKMTAGSAPRLVVSESARDAGALYYGPFRGRGATDDAVRTLVDLLGLRDCAEKQPMRFADQPSLFDAVLAPACIRHDLGTCMAPCAARCDAGQYGRAAASARAFLEGRSAGPMDRIWRPWRPPPSIRSSSAPRCGAAGSSSSPGCSPHWRACARRSRASPSSTTSADLSGEGRNRLYCIRHGVIRAEVTPPTTPIERVAFAETARTARP